MLCHVSYPELGNSLVGNKNAMRGLHVLVFNSLVGILFSPWNDQCYQIQWHSHRGGGIFIKGSSLNRVNAASNLVSIVAGCSRQQKLLCWQVNCMLPLFCAGVRLSQYMRIQEISHWEDVEEAIYRRHLPSKTFFFIVISIIITQSLRNVWNKDTIQVSDWFWSRKCGV